MKQELMKKYDLLIIDVKYSQNTEELEINYHKTFDYINTVLKEENIDKEKFDKLYINLLEQYGRTLFLLEGNVL